MKKGFTLVELLAVIVILSIIAVITIPMIKGVIDKVKLGSLEDSVYGLKSAAELYFSSNEKVETTEFICSDNGCISNTGKKLDYKGKVEGKVKIFSDGKVSICLTDDNYASSILANEKKATTKMGGCDEETYEISEVIAIEKYNELKNDYNDVKEALYNKTLISSNVISKSDIVKEINGIDLNKTSYEIYVDGNRVSSYPDGSYNVEVNCIGATGNWNNLYKGIILSNVSSEDVACEINFTTCDNIGNCDTSDEPWRIWATLLGYDAKKYDDLKSFLQNEITINSCSDIELFYKNTNGAYDYLKSQSDLMQEINQRVDFSMCGKSFSYKGSKDSYKIEVKGIYRFEVWGAQGGSSSGYYGGKGGYASGDIELSDLDSFYVYVGGAGKSGSTYSAGGWNGGGSTSSDITTDGSGGGATDIRIESDNIYSRIMVAGGGGGAGYWAGSALERGHGGVGGGLSGGNGTTGGQAAAGTGASQTSGASFGNGTNASYFGGGGGGYYGGKSGSWNHEGAGGGSGYVSGYVGAVAIKDVNTTTPRNNSAGSTCSNGTTDIVCSYHYSGYIFKNTKLLSGANLMPTWDGKSNMTGNSGNGYAKISFIGII